MQTQVAARIVVSARSLHVCVRAYVCQCSPLHMVTQAEKHAIFSVLCSKSSRRQVIASKGSGSAQRWSHPLLPTWDFFSKSLLPAFSSVPTTNSSFLSSWIFEELVWVWGLFFWPFKQNFVVCTVSCCTCTGFRDEGFNVGYHRDLGPVARILPSSETQLSRRVSIPIRVVIIKFYEPCYPGNLKS